MKTILFDLDGTLLPMSIERFTKDYFTRLAFYFADIVDSKTLIRQVLEATEVMVKNTEKRLNETVFTEHLRSLAPDAADQYMERFEDFYDTVFLTLQTGVTLKPLIPKSINLLKNKGYTLVVATNPLFPRKAILHRLHWAGLDEKDFSYISCFERNCYCKPNTAFFQEVLEEIGEQAENCLMVGNDVQEDLVCKDIGIKSFLIEDYLIHRGGNIITDYRGSYKDFYGFVQQLPMLGEKKL